MAGEQPRHRCLDKPSLMSAAATYTGLAAGYGAAIGGWLLIRRVARLPTLQRLWPAQDAPRMKRPWLEVVWVLLAAAAVIGVGQLYVRGWLLHAGGSPAWLMHVVEAINQLLIFSPLLLLLPIRRQPLISAWLPTQGLALRVLVGLALALVATLALCAARGHLSAWPAMLQSMLQGKRLAHGVQVLMEDIAIAMLLVRLGQALPRRVLASVIVAALFALGHLPSSLSGGTPLSGAGFLIADFALASAVLLALANGRDVWWFWPVHLAMGLTQFHNLA